MTLYSSVNAGEKEATWWSPAAFSKNHVLPFCEGRRLPHPENITGHDEPPVDTPPVPGESTVTRPPGPSGKEPIKVEPDVPRRMRGKTRIVSTDQSSLIPTHHRSKQNETQMIPQPITAWSYCVEGYAKTCARRTQQWDRRGFRPQHIKGGLFPGYRDEVMTFLHTMVRIMAEGSIPCPVVSWIAQVRRSQP